jgi:MFS transporter, YQGE family, putative transporter
MRLLIAKEIGHFKKLAEHTRAFLIAIVLRDFIHPVFSIFTTAFLWRENHDFLSLAVYNLSFYALIAPGFYLNGLLLRRVRPSRLYTVGMIGCGLAVSILVFSHQTTLPYLVVFGALLGIATGIYWANRNFVELHFVPNEHRNYFYGLFNAISPILNICTPLLVGWFIVLVERSGKFTARNGYEALMIIALALLFLSGRILTRHDREIPRVKTFFTTFKSSLWNQIRSMAFISGFINGASLFIAPLMILYLVGKEGALGTVTSLSSIAGAIAIYVIGRRSKQRHRAQLAALAIFILIGGAVLFSYFYSPTGVILYSVLAGLYSMLFWSNHNPIFYTAIEEESRGTPGSDYGRICDREIYLNLGRLIGILVFVFLLLHFSPETSLRYSPLILALIQLPLLIILPRIARLTELMQAKRTG